MTALAPPREPGDREPITSTAGGARIDRTFRAIAVAAGLLVLAILALIAYTTTSKAWPAFTHQGISFVTGRNWNPNTDSFGALDFIYGTLLSATIALVLAVPASLGIALFITELAPRGWRTAVTYVVDILAAIPSVVYGYWALAVLVSPADELLHEHRELDRPRPGFSASCSAGPPRARRS